MMNNERASQHPWLRVQLLVRAILGTRWDAQTWPTVKSVPERILTERGRLTRYGWFS
jgi:hypothetical protein